jgi:hypothetical protein
MVGWELKLKPVWIWDRVEACTVMHCLIPLGVRIDTCLPIFDLTPHKRAGDLLLC